MGQKELVETGPQLRVLSLNTCQTGRRYGLFEQILDFIHREKPDVILLQEVFAGSLERISGALGGRVVFSQLCRISFNDRASDAEAWGVAIGSRYKLSGIREEFYRGTKEQSEQVILNEGVFPTSSLFQSGLEVGSARFNVGTTHFTPVRGAEPSNNQLEDFKKLAILLDQTPDVVLTGDLNSPRRHKIFDEIAQRYTDNIPINVESTMDTSVRPEATWKYVIDGFFTSGHYRVINLTMVPGLSDHLGILANVQRVMFTPSIFS